MTRHRLTISQFHTRYHEIAESGEAWGLNRNSSDPAQIDPPGLSKPDVTPPARQAPPKPRRRARGPAQVLAEERRCAVVKYLSTRPIATATELLYVMGCERHQEHALRSFLSREQDAGLLVMVGRVRGSSERVLALAKK